ncbi:hypothetical protein GCM10027169_15850 [Gordonia jinhuaensis]
MFTGWHRFLGVLVCAPLLAIAATTFGAPQLVYAALLLGTGIALTALRSRGPARIDRMTDPR